MDPTGANSDNKQGIFHLNYGQLHTHNHLTRAALAASCSLRVLISLVVRSSRAGLAWNKGQCLGQGQCPVMAHSEWLAKLILHDRVDLGKLLNVKIISLEEAPEAYKSFDDGEAAKYVIDPHGMIRGAGK